MFSVGELNCRLWPDHDKRNFRTSVHAPCVTSARLSRMLPSWEGKQRRAILRSLALSRAPSRAAEDGANFSILQGTTSLLWQLLQVVRAIDVPGWGTARLGMPTRLLKNVLGGLRQCGCQPKSLETWPLDPAVALQNPEELPYDLS